MDNLAKPLLRGFIVTADFPQGRKGEYMTFQEQVVATLIGTSGGFIGSILLFWIKQFAEKRNKDKTLIRNLHYEIEYNIHLLTGYETQLTECIEGVGADSKQTYLGIDYSFIARHFSIQFYREGLISKFLHPEDMKSWNGFLSTLGEGSQEYVKDILEKWRKSEVEKEDVFKALKHERDQVKFAREMSEYLKQKIKP